MKSKLIRLITKGQVRLVAAIPLYLACGGLVAAAETPLYQDAGTPQEQRVTDLFGRLTADEKLALIGGSGFATQAIPRLGLPEMVNGPHSSASAYLLTDVLKKQWGFDGLVMSDWGGVHEVAAVQAGNDLEMPTGDKMRVAHLQAALANGSVTQAAIDESVHRILRAVTRVGLLDGPLRPDGRMVNSAAHQQVALEVAEHGIILLKNQSALLPLDSKRITSIAVIGEPGERMQINALGSPEVRPLHTGEMLDGIKARAGAASVTYTSGHQASEPFPASATGDYELEVGASLRDLRQKALLRLNAVYTEKVANVR